MIYCFDVDGTISAHPAIFKEIMRGLLAIGHEVYPLTGTLTGHPDPEESRYKQLASFGINRGEHYTDVVVCEGSWWGECGELKGRFCKEKGVVFMVEDTDPFIESIKKHSPETLCLRMPLTGMVPKN